MKRKLGFKLVAAGVLYLALVGGLASPAQAGRTDGPLFYDALSPYGDWIDYGKYGPVWYPTRVSAQWRPYLDGRWLPTDEGWVFETSEPWGWATYHFGNWMPTREYGWVWVPGSTWYPATTAWRTNDDYIGWAPLPPPDFIPPPDFLPAGGFIPGTGLELLTPPFWTFCRAPSFLLGFGQMFRPNFSFFNCGCLAPFHFVPGLFPRTALLTNFFSPAFAPQAFFVFGPPFPSVALTTNIPLSRINQFASTVALLSLRNVVPTAVFLSSHPFLNQAIPAAVLAGQRFPVLPVMDPPLAAQRLARPGVVPPPANLPQAKKEIPQILVSPGRQRTKAQNAAKMRGMRVPPQSELETGQLKQVVLRQRRVGQPTKGEAAPTIGGRGARPGGRAPLVTPQEGNLKGQLQEERLLRQPQRSRELQVRPPGVRPQPVTRPQPVPRPQIVPAMPEGRPAR